MNLNYQSIIILPLSLSVCLTAIGTVRIWSLTGDFGAKHSTDRGCHGLIWRALN